MSRPRKTGPTGGIRTTKQRTPTERALHAVTIAREYLKGKSQAEIARQIGISQQLVSYDLIAIRKIWLDQAAASFDEHLARELARIDNLERMYYEAWERSLRPRSKTRRTEKALKPSEKKTPESDDDATTDDQEPRSLIELSTYNEHEESVGDPEFLRGAERCQDRRIALLGLNAPTRTINAHAHIGLPASDQNEAIARQLLGDERTNELIDVVRARLTGEN